MPAYLFLWNPKTDPRSFKDYERVLADAAAGSAYETRWICPSTRPKEGDAAFMQRTGPAYNGVFAKGVVTRASYIDGDTRVVRLHLDSFLPSGQELTRSAIVARAGYKARWMPMASGNVIPNQLLQAILDLWREREKHVTHDLPAAFSAADELVGLEGEALRRMSIHRKREWELRSAKIADTLRRQGRLQCEVPGCGFDFLRVYGDLGRGYAHVHHLHPLARADEPRRTRLADLAVVCANCHAMIHRGGECRDMSSLLAKRPG
jgi:hypothetical protein